MTRLVWGSMADRFYESGVDKGVLYTADSLGVSWSGLIAVSEAPTGGGPRPFYFDGRKYLNLSAAEEFEATISAVNFPPEFAACDGIASIHNGLFATQQARLSFGLSYRSRIGNPVDGPSHAHKIHLVYNALAGPSQRDNKSVSDQAEPTTYSWRISTLPPEIVGYKPTAHFVVDTRYAPSDVLEDLEDILYGTNDDAARLPDVDELLTLFA